MLEGQKSFCRGREIDEWNEKDESYVVVGVVNGGKVKEGRGAKIEVRGSIYQYMNETERVDR